MTSLTGSGRSASLPPLSWTEPRVNCFLTEQNREQKAPPRCVRGKTHRGGTAWALSFGRVGVSASAELRSSADATVGAGLQLSRGLSSAEVQLLARVDDVRVVDDVVVQLEQLLPAALDVVLRGDLAEG